MSSGENIKCYKKDIYYKYIDYIIQYMKITDCTVEAVWSDVSRDWQH